MWTRGWGWPGADKRRSAHHHGAPTKFCLVRIFNTILVHVLTREPELRSRCRYLSPSTCILHSFYWPRPILYDCDCGYMTLSLNAPGSHIARNFALSLHVASEALGLAYYKISYQSMNNLKYQFNVNILIIKIPIDHCCKSRIGSSGKNGTAKIFNHRRYPDQKPCHNSTRKFGCRLCHLTPGGNQI